MENSGEHYHVIVIGAGLSGLAAALQLAQHGHRVRMITATFICVPDGSCIETLFALFQSFACRMDTVSLPDSLFFFQECSQSK
jgi:heterodisulfide reductase subunit A-like polyferredoxin